MTTKRIGLLMGLLGVGLCGACGSSTSLSAETDGDGTWTAVGGTGGTVESSGGGGGGGTGGEDSSSGDLDQKIKSGTVGMDKFVGSSTTSCQQLLRLDNPAQPLTGYLQMGPAAYLNNPNANEESYLYLESSKDAVILPGPAVSYAASTVDFSAAQLTTCVNQESACQNNDGYRVKVNERLAYVITIDDWEEEVALGRVQLCLNKGSLTTEFVFAGLGYYLGGGVAHELTITPILDGVPGTPTTPVTIECRSHSY